MDARPLFKKYEIPALKTVRIKSNKSITSWTLRTLKNSKKNGSLKNFGNIYEGLIATGDKFISNKNDIENISKEMEDLFAVEMEGASVAQVAKQEKIPFQIIRVISDEANEKSSEDFSKFLIKYNLQNMVMISSDQTIEGAASCRRETDRVRWFSTGWSLLWERQDTQF